MASDPPCIQSPSSSTWDRLVVLCAANNWDGTKLADRHMAEQLCTHVPVLYVDPPMSRLTPRNHPRCRPALDGPRLRVLAPGLARLTPVIPPKGRHRLARAASPTSSSATTCAGPSGHCEPHRVP